MSVPEQRVPLRSGSESPSPGQQRAAENIDPWWHDSARRALEVLALSGKEFSVDDLRDGYGITDPDAPGRWGVLFRHAARDGVIQTVGAAPSRRPSRSGGLARTWKGTRRFREARKAADA